MQITDIDIKNFRSLKEFKWKPGPTNVICGVNSSGKSNVRRALQFAFLESFDPARANENICFDSPGPRTAARVSLKFDKPTATIAKGLGISAMAEFEYSIQVRRSGTFTATINGVPLTEPERLAFLSEVLIVYVPPLRDISADGLKPFLSALTSALLKMRNAHSFNARANALMSVVREKEPSCSTQPRSSRGHSSALIA